MLWVVSLPNKNCRHILYRANSTRNLNKGRPVPQRWYNLYTEGTVPQRWYNLYAEGQFLRGGIFCLQRRGHFLRCGIICTLRGRFLRWGIICTLRCRFLICGIICTQRGRLIRGCIIQGSDGKNTTCITDTKCGEWRALIGQQVDSS